MKNYIHWLLLVFSSALLAIPEPTDKDHNSLSPDEALAVQADELIERLNAADLASLLDIDVELLPDWETNTPTKQSQKSSMSPANVVVISKDEISNFGYSSLSEVLNHVAGFSMTSDLTLSNFGARGIHPGARAGSRVLKVMIDGQAISYRANQQNWIDLNLIPFAMIERIEIVKGPVSALYGANAFLGVINIVTQNGDDIRIKGHVASIEYKTITNAGNGNQFSYVGGEQMTDWNTIYGLSFGHLDRSGLQLPVSAPLFEAISAADNQTLAATNDDSNPMVMYLKSRKRLAANNYWQFGVHYQILDEDRPFSDTNPLYSSGYSRVALYNSFINSELNIAINDQLTYNGQLAYSRGGPRNEDRIELGAPQFFYQRDWGYSAIDFTHELSWQISPQNLWLLGLELNQEKHQIESFNRVERDSLATSPVSPPLSETVENNAIYAQWLFQISPQVNTILGCRLDDHSIYASQKSTRAGLVWSFRQDHALKLLAGSSFQAPSVELLFRNPVQRGDIIGNPALEPQTAETLELIYDVKLSTKSRFDITLYRTHVSELVQYENDLNNQVAKNKTESKTLGVEFNANYKNDQSLYYFNLSWQQTELDPASIFVLENHRQGELFPQHSANFGISYEFSDRRWRFSLNNQYVGKRPISTSNVLVAETFDQVDDYLNSTLVLQRKLSLFKDKESRVLFKIDDLWDERFIYPGFGGIDAPSWGRSFSVTFEQRL